MDNRSITQHFPVLQDRVNTMGPQSQHRRSPIKNCKIQTTGRLSRTQKQQTTLRGGIELRVDTGTLKCKACERGPRYKKGHHPTCTESDYYKFNSGGPTPSARAMADHKAAKRNLKNNLRKLASEERGGHTNPFTRADGDAFFEPRVGTNGSSSQDTSTRQEQNTPSTRTELAVVSQREPAPSSPNNFLAPETLKLEIQKRVKSPSYLMKKSKSCPLPVAALVEYLMTFSAFRWRQGTNRIMASDARSAAVTKLERYRKRFPPGTIGFKVPKDDGCVTPDPLYSTLEGCTIYLVCWELNVPEIFLTCWETKCDGELVHRG